jgi:TolB-like protein/DNA-binding winged helix-turn-helix (wHTH) protein/Flp pilus assembly protein TadD
MDRESSREQLFQFGKYRLDAGKALLLREGVEVHLRPKSFRVLEYLVRNPGRLVTRRELMDAVWGQVVVTDDSLTQCLIDIRRAMGDDGQQAVRTVPRRGFVFEWPVTVAEEGVPEGGQDSGPASVPPSPDSPVASSPAQTDRPSRPAWAAPLLVVLVALLGLAAWWIAGRPADTPGALPAIPANTAPGNSIAVLRFTDLSPAGDKQYFADGLAEEVLHRLAQSPDLVVIARSSSFAIDPNASDVREVGARLDVAHVLEGSVRRDGDELRVTAQLIDARTGAHVWSRRFDGSAAGLMALQDDIAESVARSLEATIAARGQGAGTDVDPGAQELFLQGSYVYNRRGPGDVALARDYFERAIAIQPDHARALTALAGALRIQAFDGDMDWDESFAAQKALLTRALAADPGLAEAHLRLSNVQYAMGDFEAARESFQRAVNLDPGNPLVLSMQSRSALDAGRLDEAVELSQRVARLDPLSAVAQGNHAYMLFAAGRLEEAEAAWGRAADLSPGEDFLPDIARVRILQARFGDAVDLARSAPEGPDRDQVLAMAAAVAGTQEEADAAMRRLESAGSRSSEAMLAEVLAFQGHGDEAFAALGRAVAGSWGKPLRVDFRKEPANDWQRATNILRLSPFLAPLRSDPRWADFEDLSR